MSLFGGKQRTVRPDYTGLQVQTASSALPIPVVYGTNRIAPNFIWSDGFQTHAQRGKKAGGKGGGRHGGTGYTYSTWIMFGLAEGPVQGIGEVFSGQSVTPFPTRRMTSKVVSRSDSPFRKSSTRFGGVKRIVLVKPVDSGVKVAPAIPPMAVVQTHVPNSDSGGCSWEPVGSDVQPFGAIAIARIANNVKEPRLQLGLRHRHATLDSFPIIPTSATEGTCATGTLTINEI